MDLVCSLVGYDPAIGGQATRLPVVLATFHTCFNITNTAILIGLIPQLERVVCWLLPEGEQPKREEFRLQYIQSNLIQTPEISVYQAQKETVFFGQRVQQMFGKVKKLLDEHDDKTFTHLFSEIENQEDITDKTEMEIARFLDQVSMNHLSDETKEKVRMMLREISELESIGDACYNLARTLNRRQEAPKDFTETQYQRLRAMMAMTDDALTQMNLVLGGRREEYDTKDTFRIENDINQMRKKFKEDNIRDINEREYDYTMGTIYIDMINECEKLGDYVVNVVQARFGK